MSNNCRSWRVVSGLFLWQFFVSAAFAGIILPTPAELSEGEKFRFIFLTAGATKAESGDIAYYNGFVNLQASGATYDGNPVSWYAVASTTGGALARGNVGGFGSAVPVYLVTGVRVADNLTDVSGDIVRGLWGTGSSGFYDLYSPVNVGIDGNLRSASDVWAGSGYAGGVSVSLGNANPGYGYSGTADFKWILRNTAYDIPNTIALPMYAVSQELTANAVPEPGTLALTGVTGLLMFGRRIWRHCRPGLRALVLACVCL